MALSAHNICKVMLMDQEYPTYDEKIYNVIDQTLPPTKEQEDVILKEKEIEEKKKTLLYMLRNKNIMKIFKRTLFIFFLNIILAFFARFFLTPLINMNEHYNNFSKFVLVPLGMFFLLTLIVLLVFECYDFIYMTQYLKRKNNITKKGTKYAIFSIAIMSLSISGILIYIIYMISLLV